MCSDDEDSCCDCGLSPTVERRLLLTLVWALIIFAYISYYAIVYLPWNYYNSMAGIAHIIFFNIIVALMFVSYVKSIFTDAGQVPKDYVRISTSWPVNADQGSISLPSMVSTGICLAKGSMRANDGVLSTDGLCLAFSDEQSSFFGLMTADPVPLTLFSSKDSAVCYEGRA